MNLIEQKMVDGKQFIINTLRAHLEDDPIGLVLFSDGNLALFPFYAQLIISAEKEHSIPVEDIRTLMIESRSVLLSSYVLTALSEAGVCVYFCDEKHLPCAVLQPFARYSRQRKQLMLQLSQSKPTVKQLWQQITVAKIRNQGRCLALSSGKEEQKETVFRLAEQVKSGDADNTEARAAAIYFRALFGSSFSRSEESTTNAALNYGYAVIRGYIARKLADFGFEPCLGIHHCSELNNFNLADDLIEPFRPLVDLFVFTNISEKEDTLSSAVKHELANILNYEVLSGEEHHSCAYAIERLIHSLERCFDHEGKEDGLCLPILEGLQRHTYE